ncbi:receptor-like protein 6 [Macadamia integrifolia]|uniref:receptor-like protein 6 n=1 Tax=Macadamia integrifolia TaxID=60698 RepID=UPI001C4F7476|nr:receptor-like protein 6 [Macadamia integrifolia]
MGEGSLSKQGARHRHELPNEGRPFGQHEFIITDNISFSSWEPETDCCSWEGVTCNVTTGYVIRLDLNFKLSGPIYSNSSLFGLHHLQRLSLAYNDFKLAPIPSGFDRLPSLTHLNLSYSNFSGQIPWEFSRLTRLVSLDLSTFDFDYYDYYCYNFNICHRILKLERPNLKELIQNLTSLVELYLDGVDISSPSSSPTQGSNHHWSQVLPQSLPNLRSLSLSGCGLSGPIQSSFSQLVFLEELRLDGNYNLSLEVPNFLPPNFSQLKTLSLSSCGLYGKFPSSVFQLPNLQIFDVSNNSLLNGQLSDFPLNNSFQFISLSDINFSGAIRDSIGNLRFLTTLRLGNCNFSGSIPPSLTNLTQLTELHLSSNSFTGSVPMFNKDNVPNLTYLDLSDNLLDGTIHSSLFTLPSLYDLNLLNNQLSGRLDQLFHNSSLLSSSSLECMDLSGNKLNGQIPKSISQFSSLQSLYLSSNDFSGTVKMEDMFGNLENLSVLHLSNNNLLSLEFGNTSSSFHPQLYELRLGSCHIKEFPNFLRTQEQLWELDLSNNQIQGHVPSWIWKETLSLVDLSYNGIVDLEPAFADHSNNDSNNNSFHSRLIFFEIDFLQFETIP